MENNSKIIDLILLTIIIIFVINAIRYFQTDDETTINRSDTYYNFTNTPTFDVNYDFTSSSFSVNNPIFISIKAHPSLEYIAEHPEGLKNVTGIWVIFPDGETNSMQFAFGRIVSHPILLTRLPHDQFYRGPYDDTFGGNSTMIFVRDGDKCPTVTNKMYIEVPKECQSGDTPLIHISSYDATIQYTQGKNITGLTFVILAFAIASIRDMMQNLFGHLGRKNQDKKKN